MHKKPLHSVAVSYQVQSKPAALRSCSSKMCTCLSLQLQHCLLRLVSCMGSEQLS